MLFREIGMDQIPIGKQILKSCSTISGTKTEGKNREDINMTFSKESKNHIGMPLVGYGTYQLSADQAENSVAEALKEGFRHLDSAEGYNNEEGTGQAIKSSDVARDDIFVTTKLFPGFEQWGSPEKDYNQTIETLKNQLQTLKLDYVDLYLIHAPFSAFRLEQWQALVDLKEKGLTRHIGVSNYNQERINEIIDAGLPVPEVNQVEFHPLCAQKELTEFMRDKGIEAVGYSPLAPLSTWRTEEGQGGEVLAELKTACQQAATEIAKKLGVSEAKLLLRWGLQRGYIMLTKSNKPARINENLELFDFSIGDEDMTQLNSLDLQTPMAWAANGVDPMAIAAPLR